jgi:hypothetical protein
MSGTPRPRAVEEVLRNCETPFRTPLLAPPVFPLADEPHVADWSRYLLEAGDHLFEFLQERLSQLAIPVRAGVSKTGAYREVTRRGTAFSSAAFDGRLRLDEPQALRLMIQSHPAGALPVLATPCRQDFENLYFALACRHEPRSVAASINAQMVAGLTNWDRLRQYRDCWVSRQTGVDAAGAWPAEMARVAREEPWRFLDRVLLVCERPYSGVSAAELGLEMSEAEWLERSNALRIEHEFTHYATKRVFGVMRPNLLDEILADFMGLTRALGRFEAGWFLHFLGLEDHPSIRGDGRVHAYTAGLSPDAVTLLCEVAVDAAAGVETLATRWYSEAGRHRFFLALSSLSLDRIASDERAQLFEEAWEAAGRLLGTPPKG